MFRWLRWCMAKQHLASLHEESPPDRIRITHQRHQAKAEDFSPNTVAYERLAFLYNDYATGFESGYSEFLAEAAYYYRQPLDIVLDLACGTGLLTRQLT